MIIIPFSNEKIKYLGRKITTQNGIRFGWASGQVRVKLKGTSKLIITSDVADKNTSASSYVAYSIDNSEGVTIAYLTTNAEVYTGEKTVQINLPDTNEHDIIFKICSGAPLSQYNGDWYNILKSIQIDDSGVILDYPIGARSLMCLGDSWMATENDWCRFIDSKYAIYPVAFGGAKSDEIGNMFDYQGAGISSSDPYMDGVIIGLGVNDYFAGYSNATFKNYIQTIITRVKGKHPTTPIILLQPPRNVPNNINYDQYGTPMQELANSNYNVFYLSTADLWNNLTWLDQYHLNGEGKKALANFVSTQLPTIIKSGAKLNYYLGGQIIELPLYDKVVTTGQVLRINSIDGIKEIEIVGTTSPKTSNIRLQTSSGIKSLSK
jgi:hypothetical protein